MKRILIAAFGLVLGACAPMEYDRVAQYPAPGQDRGNGDIVVDVPEGRSRQGRRAERQQAAEECAQYGRISRRRGDGEYACVEPGSDGARKDNVRREWERDPNI